MDFDFHCPDGEDEGLYFGLSLCYQNIHQLLTVAAWSSNTAIRRKGLAAHSAHPAIEKGLCSLLFITISPMYCGLGTVLNFDKHDFMMSLQGGPFIYTLGG